MTETTGTTSMEKVYISDILKDLIPGFLASRNDELVQMQKLVDEKNFEAIAKLGHKLKGSSLNYGFNTLGQMCTDFEQAGHDKDIKKTQALVSQVQEHLKNIEIIFVNDE